MRLLVVAGTRPEAIKLAPVILEGRRRGVDVRVCVTAQHREMLDQVLEQFEIAPDHDLNLMRPDQSLADLASRALVAVDAVLADTRPTWVLVQGDTTTAMVAALAAFYRRLPIGHVEAGLRTGDLTRPFPEELNRRVIDLVGNAFFAPTRTAGERLAAEGAPAERVFLTGNTVVDALHAARAMPSPASATVPPISGTERLVLVTAHRRESFGPGMRAIARAVARIADRFPDVRVVVPVHPNPQVRETIQEVLHDRPRVHLTPPLPYLEFVHLMARAHLVISDSGGVQEEAPSLGVPALVLRETTERPEAIEAGAVRMVGVAEEGIVEAATAVLGDAAVHAAMARAVNPYGDGRASERILSILLGEPWTPFRAEGAG